MSDSSAVRPNETDRPLSSMSAEDLSALLVLSPPLDTYLTASTLLPQT